MMTETKGGFITYMIGLIIIFSLKIELEDESTKKKCDFLLFFLIPCIVILSMSKTDDVLGGLFNKVFQDSMIKVVGEGVDRRC